MDSALIVGRSLRLIVGVLLLVWMSRQLVAASGSAWLIVGALVLTLTFLYGGVHAALSRTSGSINRWLGALLALGPAVLVWVLAGVHGAVAVILFIGISLIVAAIRADPGCEVMAIPGAVSGRRTHLVCLVFSPVDWLEARLRRRA